MSPPSPPAKSPRKRSSPSDDPPAWLCVNHVKERKGELPHHPKRKTFLDQTAQRLHLTLDGESSILFGSVGGYQTMLWRRL